MGSQPQGEKTESCQSAAPGGECAAPDGTKDCTWNLEDAGEVYLDELAGIDNHVRFCERELVEYNGLTDKGVGTTFWDGKADPEKCKQRMDYVQRLFTLNFPKMRTSYGEPRCDWWR